MQEMPFRQIHLDFHTSPDIPRVGYAFDAEQFAATLAAARVNSINLFAKCHHGWFYYPTRIGQMHPNLSFDLLGDQIQACRKVGIRINIYYTVGFSERDADEHPEWMLKDRDGNSTMGMIMGAAQARSNPLINKQAAQQYFGSVAYWRYLCVNHPEYVDQIKHEMTEIVELYHPAGLWLDILQQQVCVCDHCAAEMQAQHFDSSSDRDIAIHGRMVEIRFFQEMQAFLHRIAPGTDLYINAFGQKMDQQGNLDISAARKVECVSVMDIESLPSMLWEYVHFPINAQYFNKSTFSKPVTMMSGKFHRLWGDFGSLKNIEAMEYEAFRALAYGCRVCIGDQLLPEGRLEPTVYRQIGEVFGAVEQKEPWCRDAVKQAQIGVFLDNPAPAGPGLAVEGAYRMLTELHHQFDLIDFTDNLDFYDLLILPDRVRLPQPVAEKINAFVEKGGALICTHQSGLAAADNYFALDTLGSEYLGDAEFTPRYMHVEEFDLGEIPAMDYVMYEKGSQVRAAAQAKVLTYITRPWFNRTPDRFCSHLHTPPARLTAEPCVIQHGRTIYISQPLFTDYAKVGNRFFRQVIEAVIQRLLPTPLVCADLPVTAECMLWKQDQRLVLHVVSYIIQKKCQEMEIVEERFPLVHREIRVHSKQKPLRVTAVPQRQDLPFEYDGEYVRFYGDVDGHQIFEIVYGEAV